VDLLHFIVVRVFRVREQKKRVWRLSEIKSRVFEWEKTFPPFSLCLLRVLL
jgi:hypothetical protein